MLGLVLDVCLDAQGHGMEMLDVVFCLLWRTDLLSRLGGGKAIVMMTWFGVSYFFLSLYFFSVAAWPVMNPGLQFLFQRSVAVDTEENSL